MAIATTSRFVDAHMPAVGLRQCLNNVIRMTERNVEPGDTGIKAHTAFIHLAVVFIDIGLSGFSLSEAVENRDGDFRFAIAHGVNALVSLPRDLVTILPRLKLQFGVRT